MVSIAQPMEEAQEILKAPGEKHPVYEYLANLSKGSQEGAVSKLRKAVAVWTGQDIKSVDGRMLYVYPWYGIDHTQMVTLKQNLLAEKLSKSYINTIFAHISGVLDEAAHLTDGPYRTFTEADRGEALRKVRIKGGSGDPKGRALSQGEVNALIDACARDHSPAAFRDASIISIFVACALRNAEVAALTVKDYDPKLEQIHVRGGKGMKARKVPLINGAGRTLRDWLELRGDSPGALWVPVDKGHTIRVNEGAMTHIAITKMLVKRGKQAAIASFTPHDLRRTSATLLYKAGVDILTIQSYLGHKSVETTVRYIRAAIGEQEKREAAERVHIPAVRDRMEAIGGKDDGKAKNS